MESLEDSSTFKWNNTKPKVSQYDSTTPVVSEFGELTFVPNCKFNEKYQCRLPMLYNKEGVIICSACKLDIVLRLLSRIEKEIRVFLLKQGISEEELDLQKK